MVRWLLVIALFASIGGACTLFDDDPPDDSCSTNSDCFQAQGEVCDSMTHTCVVRDAGVDAP